MGQDIRVQEQWKCGSYMFCLRPEAGRGFLAREKVRFHRQPNDLRTANIMCSLRVYLSAIANRSPSQLVRQLGNWFTIWVKSQDRTPGACL
jgi:hypothetical protein